MSISNLIHNVKNKTAPANIQNLFRNVSDIHSYKALKDPTDRFGKLSVRKRNLKSSG